MPSVKQSGQDTGKAYWRSLNELAGTAEFQDWVHREFPNHADEWLKGDSRRSFLKVMAASFALAGLTACRWPEEKIVAFSRRPEAVNPGVPAYFATAMETGGYGVGLVVKSFDGRPVKAEGNTEHPCSRGATTLQAQASILEMYDPERGNRYARREGAQTAYPSRDQFNHEARSHFAKYQANGGRGLYFLSEATNSPTMLDLRRRMRAAIPNAIWYEYEPISYDHEREGTRALFGRPYRLQPHFDRAKVILSLDHDFLTQHPASLAWARDYAASRDPKQDEISRLYAVEGVYSLTGAMADHRVILEPSRIEGFTFALLDKVIGLLGNDFHLSSAIGDEARRFRNESYPQDVLNAIANDLVNHRGAGVVVAGPRQSAAVHAAAQLLNVILGNVGETVGYILDAQPERPHHYEAIADLTRQIEGGAVETLVILGGNPAYDAPADLDFSEKLSQVSTSFHLSLYENETSKRCSWYVPRAHHLESWGDAIAYDGTVSMVQPLIAPLYEGMSAIEAVALAMGDELTRGYDLVRRTFEPRFGAENFEAAWRTALHDGVVANSAPAVVAPSVDEERVLRMMRDVEPPSATPTTDEIDLVFLADPRLYDGRYANNGWLQELPDTLTKLTWDNALFLSPATAKTLGARHERMARLTLDGESKEIVVYVMPGLAPNTAAVWLGHGRRDAGRVGNGVGFDVYPLRASTAMDLKPGASIEPLRQRYILASTQDHFAIDALGARERERRVKTLIQEANHQHYKENPTFAKEYGEHYPKHDLWTPPVEYDGHKWGMAIDLNSCIGCNACVVACQAENNIPVVGKQQVRRGREMHWIRVDTYFKGDPNDPGVAHQPMTCLHCENAPCEQVCPVAATVHDHEGLNVMVYNRCVGTRYCSNNCPVKVRRFNFFNFNYGLREVEKMRFNPEVTVRNRGVMEKCTFCTQRLQEAKIRARNEKRPLHDGEAVSACAQACPTKAITFGDLNDVKSEIARKHEDERCYSILDILYIKPRAQYLARIHNPNPELVNLDNADTNHGHVSHT